ncbi:FimV/HubP family polar landmark protein [Aeromonas salmonicida]|uniref:Pilus assembly protein FimV n=1 Tax=Escherichia coli TaxID=562 RepID=A0A3L0W0D0_ECOLX|nr:FimV/HubP family polar landmark protein [Aeromonas salmonicida]HEH9413357.1 pilus assembly protein FimV [Aeromonas salmonicida]HEH9422364.1 pilus assembly protein FimV [Aeromonas salmonicida]HEH9435423.1 pilus assembly protein FimV [Aeromonas salmonicida]
MGHSRITLAMLLALGLLGTAQAEDPAREPFFVELKGPDEPAPPAVNSQPLAQPVAAPRATSQPSRPTAQPIVRQVASNAGSYGPVRPTDTLWSLASKHRPSNRVSVYQTMVAIYEKNPRSFADGNINHILVGSRILLPTAAEASVITDAQARQRFNSDNASWKGLSPKYLASKQTQPAKPAAPKVAAVPAKAPVPKAAPIPAPAPKVAAPQPATEVKEVAKAAEPVPSQAPATSAPAPLPADLGKPVGQPSTEMALALEDANAQLGQVTEMNHRLKLRLQSLTEEVETLKAQLLEQTALQKEIAELKTKPVPPVAATPEPKQHWLMDLLSSPLNLAMIILLPVLLVLALVTLWLRARARRELEEQEKSLSESTSMVMDQEHSEFDDLFSADITDDEPVRPMPDLNTPDGYMAVEEPAAPADIVFSDDGEMELAGFEAEPAPKAAGRDPDLVPDLDLADDEAIALDVEPDLDLANEFNPPAKAGNEVMSEEELQAALFAELDADLTADLDLDADDDGQPDAEAPISDEELAAFDLSDFESAFAEAEADQESAKQSAADTSADEMLAELGLAPTEAVEQDLALDPNELALSDFEDAFAEVESHEGDVKPREQANESGYVEIDKLLAEADATTTEQEPYQGFSLDVGLDGFPEVLPESTGFDVDADDGGVGAKLDLARAYLEIDDKDSARELLQEAAEQGSDHQRAEAEKLLKRLG